MIEAIICWGNEEEEAARTARVKNLTAVLREIPITPPSLVLPIECNHRSIMNRAVDLGIRVIVRPAPGGWGVWRIE